MSDIEDIQSPTPWLVQRLLSLWPFPRCTTIQEFRRISDGMIVPLVHWRQERIFRSTVQSDPCKCVYCYQLAFIWRNKKLLQQLRIVLLPPFPVVGLVTVLHLWLLGWCLSLFNVGSIIRSLLLIASSVFASFDQKWQQTCMSVTAAPRHLVVVEGWESSVLLCGGRDFFTRLLPSKARDLAWRSLDDVSLQQVPLLCYQLLHGIVSSGRFVKVGNNVDAKRRRTALEVPSPGGIYGQYSIGTHPVLLSPRRSWRLSILKRVVSSSQVEDADFPGENIYLSYLINQAFILRSGLLLLMY